MAEQQNWLC